MQLIGIDKVRHVEKKGDVAFVTMTTQTYAQAVMTNESIEAEISPYYEKKSDPLTELSKRFNKMKIIMTKQIESLQLRVGKLERAINDKNSLLNDRF